MNKKVLISLVFVIQLTAVCLSAEQVKEPCRSDDRISLWFSGGSEEVFAGLFTKDKEAETSTSKVKTDTLKDQGGLGINDVQSYIDEAAALAVRNEEVYLASILRSHEAVFNQQLAKLEKERNVWVRASLVEGGILLAGLLASFFVMRTKS